MITDIVRGYMTSDMEINQMGMYYLCATLFGFTPSQVDSIDSKTLQGMLLFNTAKCAEEESAMKKATRR